MKRPLISFLLFGLATGLPAQEPAPATRAKEIEPAMGDDGKTIGLTIESQIIWRTGDCLFFHTLSPKDQAGEIVRDRKFLVFVKCEELPIP